MSTINDLRDGEFEQRVLHASGPVLVHFWAAWCGPCRKMAPVVGAVMEGMRGRVRLLQVDTDENVELPEECDVSSIPTLILYAAGKEIRRFVGKQTEEALREGLEQALQTASSATSSTGTSAGTGDGDASTY